MANREIKFRAFVKKDKAMVSDVRIGNSLNDCLKSDSVVFMQYTGLKDANGVDVYEGDILEQYHFTSSTGKGHSLFHRVVWSEKYDGWFCLNCKSNDENDGSCQFWVYNKTPFIVAGNIYQNQELLK